MSHKKADDAIVRSYKFDLPLVFIRILCYKQAEPAPTLGFDTYVRSYKFGVSLEFVRIICYNRKLYHVPKRNSMIRQSTIPMGDDRHLERSRYRLCIIQ